MANYKDRTPMAIELIEDLMDLITIPGIKNQNPIKMGILLDGSIAQLKQFFENHYQGEKYEEPSDLEKKVSFWDRFSHHVLASEIADKPEGMPDEEFLLDVKFKEYSYSAKNKVMSISSGCHSWSISVLNGDFAGEYVVFDANF